MIHYSICISFCIHVFLNLCTYLFKFQIDLLYCYHYDYLYFYFFDMIFIHLFSLHSLRPAISGCQLERLPTFHSTKSILDTQKSQDFFEISPCFLLPSLRFFFCCCCFPRVLDGSRYITFLCDIPKLHREVAFGGGGLGPLDFHGNKFGQIPLTFSLRFVVDKLHAAGIPVPWAFLPR